MRAPSALLDLLVLQKDDDGEIEAFEIDDFEELDELRVLEAEIAEILAEEDVVHLAESMENGSTAGVVVWENRWAAPFASAARRARWAADRLGSHPDPGDHRVPRSRDPPTKEIEMPLRPMRRARRGVIGAPVARTAAVVGTAAVVSHGVNRRQDRRQDRRGR